MRNVAIALAVGFVLLAALLPLDVPMALYFGWIAFLARVRQRMEVHGTGLAVAGAALALFTAGVHWMARSWRQQLSSTSDRDERPWKLRWSLAIVAVVLLAFAAGTCMIGVTHQVGWLLSDPEPFMGSALNPHSAIHVAHVANIRRANNLRQIGIALSAHQDHYASLPPGGSFSRDGAMLHSWATHLLPFVNYSTEGIDFTLPWNHPENEKYFRCVIFEYINPAFRAAPVTDSQGFGLNHFAANERVLGGNRRMKLEDITDGTATTLLIGEVPDHFKPWGHPVNWRDPAKGINKSPNGFGGPPGSTGANFVMADGSVRFVSDHIGPEVLRALSTPAGGEVINPDVLAEPQ
jgi:prepilin-type processing-associated H-X9-DG protein